MSQQKKTSFTLRVPRAVSVGTLALALTVAPASDLPLEVATAPSFEPEAFATVGGARIPLDVGTEIIRLSPQADGSCGYLELQIETRSPRERPFGRVTVAATADCRIVVTEKSFTATPKALPDHPLPRGISDRSGHDTKQALLGSFGFVAAAVTREIYGRHLMHEQFHFTTTLAHSQYRYDDTGSTVGNVSGTAEYCWHDNLGWTTTNCYASLDNNGPSQVRKTTYGSWTNPLPGLNHSLQAHAFASPGGSFDASGTFSGTVWPFWHDHVEKGMF